MERALTCPVCISLLEDACQTNCGHSFCNKCILNHLTRSEAKVCPICRTKITAVFPSYTLRQIVEEKKKELSDTENDSASEIKEQININSDPVAYPPDLHAKSDELLKAFFKNKKAKEVEIKTEPTAAAAETTELLNSRRAERWSRFKPILYILAGVVNIIAFTVVVICAKNWNSSSCDAEVLALALSISALCVTPLACLHGHILKLRKTNLDSKGLLVAREFTLFLCFSFSIPPIVIASGWPLCLWAGDCTTGCDQSLVYVMNVIAVIAWLCCAEVLAIAMPFVWLSWTVFGLFRILVCLFKFNPGYCYYWYERLSTL